MTKSNSNVILGDKIIDNVIIYKERSKFFFNGIKDEIRKTEGGYEFYSENLNLNRKWVLK